MFLGNCPPTPPLTLTLTSRFGHNVRFGEGQVGSSQKHTFIRKVSARVTVPVLNHCNYFENKDAQTSSIQFQTLVFLLVIRESSELTAGYNLQYQWCFPPGWSVISSCEGKRNESKIFHAFLNLNRILPQRKAKENQLKYKHSISIEYNPMKRQRMCSGACNMPLELF